MRDGLDCLEVKACRCHALKKAAVAITIDWVPTRTRVDQDHLIAQLERHDNKADGRLIVGQTRSAKSGLDLFDAHRTTTFACWGTRCCAAKGQGITGLLHASS